MRIGYTNWYTGKHYSQRGNEKNVSNTYIFVVAGKSRAQMSRLWKALDEVGLDGIFRMYLGHYPLPNIEFRDVEKVDEVLRKQGVELDPKRFNVITDWEEVFNREASRNPTLRRAFDYCRSGGR